MFQLIVSVISIALVAALAIASIFYGGDAFTKSSEKATVTTLINQAQQIAGAASLYKTNEGVNAPVGTISNTHVLITDGYLAQPPSGSKVTGNVDPWSIVSDSGDLKVRIMFITDADEVSLCEEIEKQGVGTCTTDSDGFEMRI